MDEKMKNLIAEIAAWLISERRGGVRFVTLDTLQCEFVGADITGEDVHLAWCHLVNAADTLTGVVPSA